MSVPNTIQNTFDTLHELQEAVGAAYPLYLKHARREGPVKKITTETGMGIQEIRFEWTDAAGDGFKRIYTLK